MTPRGNPAERAGGLLVQHSGWFIGAILIVTALLVVPLILLAPTEQASQDPGGPVFDLQEKVDQLFPPRVHVTAFILEGRQGDILRQEPLWELYQNEQALRNSELGRFLYTGYDADNDRRIFGLFSLADAVQNVLRLAAGSTANPQGVTLETATDDQVKLAIHYILAGPSGQSLRDSLSKDASFERRRANGQEINYWRAAALSSFVASDNEMLGGGSRIVNISGDEATLRKERFNRQVQEILRGGQTNFRLWGIAIDVNLESREEGRTAFPFIVATAGLALAVVGLTLRSLRAVGLTFLGLAMLMVWLKGGSNLIDLKSSLTLDLDIRPHRSHRHDFPGGRLLHPRRGPLPGRAPTNRRTASGYAGRVRWRSRGVNVSHADGRHRLLLQPHVWHRNGHRFRYRCRYCCPERLYHPWDVLAPDHDALGSAEAAPYRCRRTRHHP
jgi:hypothetical protein